MKNLLVIPLVFLAFCVFADDRVVLGSFERETAEADDGVSNAETTLNGFGARLFNFKDEGFYLGASFAHLTGDSDLCVGSDCVTVDATGTVFSGEIGRDMGQWIPYVGLSFTSSEVDFMGTTDSDETVGLNAGMWLELDTFKIRGAVVNLDDEDNRAVFGGFLFQMDNNFALGAEFGMNLDDEVDGFRFSLQFGRQFQLTTNLKPLTGGFLRVATDLLVRDSCASV